MGLDAESQHAQALVHVAFPHLLAVLDEGVAAPDGVDEHVQVPLFPVDALDQRLHLLRLEVVDHGGDALAARPR
ncbi:hypothetical protein GCM10020000_81880 [Streptomyces olivoverticillatus]